MAEMVSPIEGGIQAARGIAGGVDAALYERVQATERGIVNLSSSLNGISQQMAQFSVSLQAISSNITAETSLERAKERQEQQQEFLLAQQQIREGKESAVERKIQSSLSAPVQKISAKAENTLGRLKNIFTGVLFGWLALSTVGLINRYGKEVPAKFASVRDSVLLGLNKAGEFLSTIKSALTNTFSTISSISSRVAQHVNVGWFSEPVKSLIEAVKGAFKKFFNVGPGSNKDGTGGSDMRGDSTEGSAQNLQMNESEESEKRSETENTTSTAGLSSLSNMLMSQSALSNLGMSTEQTEAENKTSQPTSQKVEPLKINQEPVSGSNEVHSEEQEKQPAMYGEIKVSPLENVEGLDISSSPVEAQTTPVTVPQAQVSPIAKQDISQKVGALPEPAPNVVVATAPAQQQAQQGYAQGRAPAYEVPTLLTSNPNNFYAMYSKTVYNVIG